MAAKYTLEEPESEGELYCLPGTWAVESKVGRSSKSFGSAGQAYCQQPIYNKVTRCDFDCQSRLLAVGFSGGASDV